MTFWDFLWSLWDSHIWVLIGFVLLIYLISKAYDFYKTYFLVKKIPNEETQKEIIANFNSLKRVNNIARDEIDVLHNGLSETKNLLEELNEDITNLHKRIKEGTRVLKNKKKKKIIEKKDIQEVIDILNR